MVVLFDVPSIQAQELQQLDTEVKLEGLEFEPENINKTKKKTGKQFTENVLTNAPIQPTLEITNQGEWQLSQNQNYASEINDEEKWPEPIHDSQTFWLILVDELEYRLNDEEDTFNWDVLGWVGGDYERLWIKTEGDIGLDSGDGEAELQLLYGKLISPFWDLQAGVRYDQLSSSDGDRGRVFGVIGVQGLTPYLFEVDAALFVSQEGDISARLKAEYQLLLSQRLILQPEFETNIALQPVEKFGVGSGINDIELGLRLRYEFSRKFAPYLGVQWTRKLGGTANLAREKGGSVNDFAVVLGFRLLF
ncbi:MULTISPECIES: copper resistance protein B [Spirulina sp. CCY15215]|uniref:copper resistance protein B n=1 Tax=Spirulina sp. CCY15215 TaxID=2767591 RepID=UPI001950381D|nr:copper resistance protein B [Spirulina major]